LLLTALFSILYDGRSLSRYCLNIDMKFITFFKQSIFLCIHSSQFRISINPSSPCKLKDSVIEMWQVWATLLQS